MSGRAQRWLELLLFGSAVTAAVAAGLVGVLADPLAAAEKAQIKVLLGLATLAVVLLECLPTFRRVARLSIACHVAVALAALAAFFHFGSFPGGRFVDYWEHFHYQLGSKYFPELAYDGLYAASLSAQAESASKQPVPEFIRDLRTNWHIATDSPDLDLEGVRARFESQRWRDFVNDHQLYLHSLSPETLEQVRLDHGYNPSPTWTFVGRLFSALLPANSNTLRLLASLDVVLIAILFAAVFTTFGIRRGCLAVALFGLGFGWPFHHVGAFLRLDWLAASVLGFCWLQREQHFAAGAAFGYAAMVRLFPALFLLGPGVLAVRAWLRGERPSWPLRIFAGFAAAVALSLVAGSLTGRGPSAWTEFAHNIELHRNTWARSRVGLDGAVLNGPDLVRWAREPESKKPWRRKLSEVRRDLEERRWPARAATAVLLLPLAAAMARTTLAQSAILGIGAIYLFAPVGSYYWIMLLAVPLLSRRSAILAFIGLAALLHTVHGLTPWIGLAFTLMSLGLAPALLIWTLPEALGRADPESESRSGRPAVGPAHSG